MKRLFYAALALSLSACGGSSETKPENVLTSNSFDEFEGWIPADLMPFLTREKSHSSPFSASVNQANEYAGGYSSTLGKLSTTRLTKMKLHAWVWLPNRDAKGAIVVQVSEPTTGKTQFYDAIDLIEASKKTYNKWVEIEKVVSLPPEVTSSSVFKTYLWRAQSTQPVYLDDFQLERAE